MLRKIIFFLLIFSTLLVPLVYADNCINEAKSSLKDLNITIQTTADIIDVPTINARHAIILDRNSESILYGKKEKEICKMASTTKIMTAIVVLENSNLADVVTITKKAAQTGGSRLGLSNKDTITVENLLYGLMMRSRK